MVSVRAVLGGLLAAGLLSAAPAYAQDGAKGVDEAWIGAVKAGNVDAVVALYAPDAVLYPPDALEARGTAAIRASYTEMLGAMTINEATIDSQYQTSGDFSVGFGKATLTMTPKGGGSPQIVSVRVTAVARKIGGKWLYVVDHASAPMPPTPPPKP
ncbi:MAG TPA: nuclear transport factor 2 family protein [Vicinamibacterales bacterium]|jgi:uncharacterized protein (TIGR02246 family)|nr:nuclear transport factor 2 family protein [Vicinamibacterales bacterium]